MYDTTIAAKPLSQLESFFGEDFSPFPLAGNTGKRDGLQRTAAWTPRIREICTGRYAQANFTARKLCTGEVANALNYAQTTP